jgi:hypothetical protein
MWAGMALLPSAARRAGSTYLTGIVLCLGLATSPLDGHDTTYDLNVSGRDLFKKAQARPGLGCATPAWPEIQAYS